MRTKPTTKQLNRLSYYTLLLSVYIKNAVSLSIQLFSRHIFLMKRSSVEDILACFLALSGKVTETFASQFARTEAVLLIVVNDVFDAVLSLHRIY